MKDFRGLEAAFVCDLGLEADNRFQCDACERGEGYGEGGESVRYWKREMVRLVERVGRKSCERGEILLRVRCGLACEALTSSLCYGLLPARSGP